MCTKAKFIGTELLLDSFSAKTIQPEQDLEKCTVFIKKSFEKLRLTLVM